MQDTEQERGRPPAEAPIGRVTLKEAAAQAGVSYATAYRRTTSGEIAHWRDDAGVISIMASDVDKIKLRPGAENPRPAISVRPDEKTAAAFARAAKAAGDVPVSRWLMDLGTREIARIADERREKRRAARRG